ncbi:MAG TPA: hypothetical protein ACFYD6_12035 [Candidatus Brocadiia bacterium]|nr:hypothetical protein [Candidatus Brocadiales bacterium]
MESDDDAFIDLEVKEDGVEKDTGDYIHITVLKAGGKRGIKIAQTYRVVGHFSQICFNFYLCDWHGDDVGPSELFPSCYFASCTYNPAPVLPPGWRPKLPKLEIQ